MIYACYIDTAAGFIIESWWPSLKAAQARAGILQSQMPGNPQPAIAGFSTNHDFDDEVRAMGTDFDQMKAELEAEADGGSITDAPLAQRFAVRH